MIRSILFPSRPVVCLAGCIALSGLVGCAKMPDVPMPAGPAGAYPALLPIDDILAQADVPPR